MVKLTVYDHFQSLIYANNIYIAIYQLIMIQCIGVYGSSNDGGPYVVYEYGVSASEGRFHKGQYKLVMRIGATPLSC